MSHETSSPTSSAVNGAAAAALVAAAFGCLLLGVLAVAADGSKHLASALIFYRPTGPLSGVTTLTIVGWLLAWGVLRARWRGRSLNMGRIATACLLLLAGGVLLTFPPFGDLLLGR